MTGTCKFCNQTMIVDGAENQQAADEYATEHCRCEEGRAYRNIEQMKKEAKENAADLFPLPEGANCKEKVRHELMLKTMNCIIDNVADGIIQKATIKINERVTASIFITAKDGIRIKKNYKEEYVLEANHY